MPGSLGKLDGKRTAHEIMTVKCVYNKYQMSYLYAMDKAKLFSICLTIWLKSGEFQDFQRPDSLPYLVYGAP